MSQTSFEKFWAAYPRHVAKKDAVKAWTALNPDAALLERILAALEWQREQWTDLQYAPYPASYLRGERWTDEKPAAPVKTERPVLTRFASLGQHHRKT